jgi:DNA-directed RNA polymerase
MDWLDQQHDRCELLQPQRLPMLCRPLPFAQTDDGGYLSPLLRRPLMRVPTARMATLCSKDSMPDVYRMVNGLQDVPWRVNTEVYEVVSKLWELGRDIPKTARREDIPVPAKLPEDAPKEKRALHKLRGREIHSANEGNKGRRIAASQTLSIARRFLGRKFHYPYKLDFRGRVYCVPQFLTPQGSDLAKGLLLFDTAKPIGPSGGRWLKIHLANCFGVDKVSLEERVRWADANHNEIMRVAKDPLGSTWWHKADAPVCFLAACIEYAGFIHEGERFLTRLPICVDGSANGIQHLSAMSLDEGSGKHVNLLPCDKPGDIYAVVSSAATQILQQVADGSIQWTSKSKPKKGSKAKPMSPADCRRYAEMWLQYGLGRRVCKRPVMILPYGGTPTAVARYIDEEVTERMLEDRPHPFGNERTRAVRFLAAVVWKVMAEVIAGPRSTMQWTKTLASATNKAGVSLSWRTPSGFAVRQHYNEKRGRRIVTRIGWRAVSLIVYEDTPVLDRKRQARSLAPNWIHSFDGAAMCLTINGLFSTGVTDIMAIHDSFGTHACDMDSLARQLRVEFVRIYSVDRLAEFRGMIQECVPEAELPEPPPRGTLDITQVMESKYFFA